MENKEITLHIKFNRRQLTALLALFFLSYHPGPIGSESLTLTTYYPAPYGGYVSLLTTGGAVATPMNTLLSRDAGNVGIGTNAPQAKLAVMGGNTGIGRVTANFPLHVEGTEQIENGNLQVIGGNIGIGITPAFPLHVSGDARINGNLGIGMTPAYPLDVSGDIRIANTGYIRNFCERVRYTPNGSTNCSAGMRVVGFQGDGIPRVAGFLPLNQTTSASGTYVVLGEDWGGYMICCRYI